MRLPWSAQPSLVLGTFCLGLRTLRLPVEQARVHAHVLGKTGSGKSYFLAHLFLSLRRAGLAATLLDPHGDLAELILAQLSAAGALDDPAARSRLIYLDLPACCRRFDNGGHRLSETLGDDPVSEAPGGGWVRWWIR